MYEQIQATFSTQSVNKLLPTNATEHRKKTLLFRFLEQDDKMRLRMCI